MDLQIYFDFWIEKCFLNEIREKKYEKSEHPRTVGHDRGGHSSMLPCCRSWVTLNLPLTGNN